MTGGWLRAVLAVPGALERPTGGYGYARRLLAEAPGAGLVLRHLELPDGFPFPSALARAEAARRLAALPAGVPVIIDGLALGVLPAALLAGLPGPAIALCHHPLAEEGDLTPAMVVALRRSERAALAACRGVIVPSETIARRLVRDYGVEPARITVARPGTDPVGRAPGRGAGAAVDSAAAEGAVRLLAVGSLVPRKGHDLLLEALSGLGALAWRLTIVGAADADPAHAGELRRRAAAPPLAGRVEFAGALDAAALAAAYADADLFVLATRHEGFGMALREAMAHGLPVLATAAGAVPEACLGAARLVPPENVAALRAALAGLIRDAAARAALAARGRAAAARFERWTDTAAAVTEAVRAVLGGAGGEAGGDTPGGTPAAPVRAR